MRNIKQPIRKILLNTLTTADVGLYEDYKSKKKVLTFKKAGIQIYGDTYTGGSGTPATTGVLASNMHVAKSVTDDGKLKGVLVDFVCPAPCVACDWEYYLTFRSKVKEPGVRNAKTNLQQMTYCGVLPAIESTGATVNDAYILLAENDLMDQITNDVGLHNINQDVESKFSGAIINAYRAYEVTTTNANTDKVKLTSEAGVDETIDLDKGATIITAVDDMNTDNTLSIWAIAISATKMLIVGPVGYKFVAADGGGGTTCTVKRFMLFVSKDKKVQFDCIFENGFAIQKGVYIEKLDVTTQTTTKIDFWVDGVLIETDDGTANPAALVVAINADFTSNEAYASILAAAGVIVYIYTDSDLVDSFNVALDPTSTLVFTGDKWSALGRYASLTSEDIFRMFFNQKDGGSLSAMQYLDQPIEGSDYVLYDITVKDEEVPALHGASYNVTHESQFQICILKSLVSTDIWDKTNPASAGARYTYMAISTDSGFVADSTIEELLGILTGVAPSLW